MGIVIRKRGGFTTSRGVFDRENYGMKLLTTVLGFVIGLMIPVGAMAQAMVPPTGMDDAAKPMPMVERMQRRFPQPVRVGDLVGLPVLDDSASTLGYVRQVVRTSAGKTALVVSYSKWFGWFGWLSRPVAVPLEVVGIEGRQLVSLDMPPSEYAAAPTWQPSQDAMALPNDSSIPIALARN
jgi:hypothetical protein